MRLLFNENAKSHVPSGRAHKGATPPSLAAHEMVWDCLFERRDTSALAPEDGVSVSHVRQEEIASVTGLPLHAVIEAIARLESIDRVVVERRSPGMPNRYLLYRASDRQPDRTAPELWTDARERQSSQTA